MKKFVPLMVFFLIFSLCPISGFAASPWTEKDGYVSQTAHKLEFGFKNLFLGWTEIFTKPHQACKSGADFSGKMEAKVEGLKNAVVYTVGGALHVATFAIPIDVEIPNNGVSFD